MLEKIRILHLETSSTVCSVCISEDEKILDKEEIDIGYTHAENLHVFIQSISQRSGVELKSLDAVAISSGPGSYTGLRIGMSAAKGLCQALGIPLIGISSLASLSYNARRVKTKKSFYIPLLDARRMEVYFAVYDESMNEVIKPAALIINKDTVSVFKAFNNAIFFGSGMEKCKEILESTGQYEYLEGIVHSSVFTVEPALKKFKDKDFLDVAYCEPDYLKDFFDTRKNQNEKL
jgi:tRNA threonylcarbamoyladenosine biosynthesis protein TsaB